MGNALEFYDFVTFALFAIQIGGAFFPSHSRYLSLMGSLATFGAGFITRPLGAHVLGGYADRHGRKPAMLVSLGLMGAGIVMLCLTPSYATIGIAAPILAVLARLLQGFALGGEVGASTVYMMESARADNRGFSMSWQGASQQVASTAGSLVALLLSLGLTHAEFSDYGWRIALLLGVTVVPVALWLRRTLPECRHLPEEHVIASGGFRTYRRALACGFVLLASATITTYIGTYMATYGQNTLGLSASVAQAGQFANSTVAIASVLLGGMVSDTIGRKPVNLWSQFLLAAVIVPCFAWIVATRGAASFIGANMIFALVAGFGGGAKHAAIVESLPRAVRARAFALVYAIPIATFGGTTQLVVTWLLHVTGNPMSIAWYLTAVVLVGATAVAFMHESAPVKLARARTT